MLKWLSYIVVLSALGISCMSWSAVAQASVVSRPEHSLPRATKVQADQGGDLIYHNGPVSSGTLLLYSIFLISRSEMSNSAFTIYKDLLIRFSQDAGSSTLYRMLSQYSDTSGGAPSSLAYGGTFIVPRDHNPQDHIYSDQDMRSIVTQVQQTYNIPADVHHLFAVFGENGDKICTEATGVRACHNEDFCGYHSFFGPLNAPTIYTVIGYPSVRGCQVPSSPNNLAADSTISTLSHEIWEAATDPLVNGQSAWYDARGEEIADKCNGNYGLSFPFFGGDVYWNGHLYEIQQEWNNTTHSCVLG